MRGQLRRDVRREALTRTEEAARTEKDFDELTKEWDKWDANRERKERYHEISLADAMFDWDIFYKQMRREKDFINEFFMCICQMHNLVDDPDISRLIGKATDKQKKVFFTRVIVGCSTIMIAHCHGMTDRNVRKLIDLMLDNIRLELYDIFVERSEAGTLLVYEHRRFLDTYKEIYQRKKNHKEEKAAKKADMAKKADTTKKANKSEEN